jgi:predicted aldo/keto reductase-like oxidoreductase
MTDYQSKFSRRRFLKVTAATGLGTILAPHTAISSSIAQTDTPAEISINVPTRPFGRSGIQVSILSLGGMFDIAANHLLLKQALQWGVTYWDTADCYHGGSEVGIGKYFAKSPGDREKIFLVSKSDARDPDGMSKLLDRSLERLQTHYVDLYFVHGIRSIGELNDATRKWAETAKAQKKIRLFGFSTHSNMEECLMAASRLSWIDGVMMTYNFRNMNSEKMKDAVAACAQAGIGLTAMKTQAGASWYSSSPQPDLGKHFMAKGWSEEQARLKAVWQNPQIASICSQMDSLKLLKANAQAASDPTPLSSLDNRLLAQYADCTSGDYCAGCGAICESAVSAKVPVSDVMRYHMYCQSYGRPGWARAHFAALPAVVRAAMADMDYTEAERRCPRNMPIGRLMREALDAFA